MLVAFRRFLSLTLLAGGVALLPSACARNDSSIYIRGCLATTDRTQCMYQVESTSAEIFRGEIDAAYASQYTCFAIVQIQMVAVGDPNTLKTETDGVELYEAEVQVLDPSQNNLALKQFSVPIAGYIDPSMGGTAGVAASEIVMLDSDTLQAEAAKVTANGTIQTVVASVIAKGRTLGGLEVHTQEFLFPIDIANGGTCANAVGVTGGCCEATTIVADCRLGIDEGTSSCINICGTFGACGVLECPLLAPGVPDLANAHCPTKIPADNSCCTTP